MRGKSPDDVARILIQRGGRRMQGGVKPPCPASIVVGVTDALSMPSFQSIVPSLVSREQIGNGLALDSTQFNLSRILGPAVAGLLISSVGILACFMVNTASYVPFIGVALWILPRASARSSGNRACAARS